MSVVNVVKSTFLPSLTKSRWSLLYLNILCYLFV